jgi:hypothetical protein
VISYLDPRWPRECTISDAASAPPAPRQRESLLGLWSQNDVEVDRSNAVDMTEANSVVTPLAQAVEIIAKRGAAEIGLTQQGNEPLPA